MTRMICSSTRFGCPMYRFWAAWAGTASISHDWRADRPAIIIPTIDPFRLSKGLSVSFPSRLTRREKEGLKQGSQGVTPTGMSE
jgi:hypothetical protein